jgi:hypothetical protein
MADIDGLDCGRRLVWCLRNADTFRGWRSSRHFGDKTLAVASATRALVVRFNSYFALCIAFAATSLTFACIGRVQFAVSMAEYLAALAALAVFMAVQIAFLWVAAAREREAQRRQWEAELRTRGA